MAEHVVTSWSQLHDLLYANSWQESLGRFRSSLAYRGMTSEKDDLTTSLIRLGGNSASNEPHLLRNFRKYAGAQAELRGDSIWNWLALAQHHGLPTRLLDWTYSPFTALHFATADPVDFDQDGVVWAVDYAQAHELLPDELKRVLDEEGSDVFTAEMIDRVAPTLTDLDRLARKEDFVLFLEPPSLDSRIVNQFALFSLMSSPTALLHEWLGNHPQLSHRFVLPAKLKWEIRDKLDQANITERVLFPGLDGLSRWLKRYYSPSPNAPGKTDAHQKSEDDFRQR